MAERRYVFEKYRTKANRLTCPKCGRPHCLTRYVDLKTGTFVNNRVGRCDHVQSCGYDYTPYQFYLDNPWEKRKNGEFTFSDTSKPFIPQSKPEYRNVDFSMVRDYHSPTNTFCEWIASLLSDRNFMNWSYENYFIGTFTNFKGEQGVIFWQIDTNGFVRDGKIMYYNANGHRKQYMTWISAELKRSRRWGENVETQKCFFGEHLIKWFPDNVIILVESEKSAFLGSILITGYNWIATCGCGQLKPETAKILRGHKVIVFPDAGEKDKWERQLKYTGGIEYRMVDTFENCPPNTDIVDLLMDGTITPDTLQSIIQQQLSTF